MGNSVFSRRWLGNSRSFRPRVEHLERRVHLAADVGLVMIDALDATLLPSELDAAHSADQTVLQRNILVEDGQFRAAVSVLASTSVSHPAKPDLVVETISMHNGEVVRTTQHLDPQLVDHLVHDPPRPPADAPTAEWTASLTPASTKLNRTPNSPPGQVVATRYSTERESDSSANEIFQADAEQLGSSYAPAVGTHAFELPPAITAAPLPHDNAEPSTELAIADDAEAQDLESTLPSTDFSESLSQSPRCVPTPIRPTPPSSDDANSPTLQESCPATPAGTEDANPQREPHERWACRLVHTASKTKLLANMQEYAWMDVLVGAPIGRLSVLNGFDVFHELQTETPTDETPPPTANLIDAFHCGALTVGLSAAGIVMLRSNLSRKRIEAKDSVFGSSIHLDETLAPPA